MSTAHVVTLSFRGFIDSKTTIPSPGYRHLTGTPGRWPATGSTRPTPARPRPGLAPSSPAQRSPLGCRSPQGPAPWARSYGYELVQSLRGTGLSDIADGTVYPALARLEREGRVTSRLVSSRSGPTASTTGQPRAGTPRSTRARRAGCHSPGWSTRCCPGRGPRCPPRPLRRTEMTDALTRAGRLRIERAVWTLDACVASYLPRRSRAASRGGQLRRHRMPAPPPSGPASWPPARTRPAPSAGPASRTKVHEFSYSEGAVDGT